MKNKRKGKVGLIVWASVGGVLLVVLTVFTILANTVLFDLFVALLGNYRAVFADGELLYEMEYTEKDDVLEAANALNVEVCEEGFVLLKNDNNALPIATTKSENNKASSKPKISVFGKNSVDIAYGGSGSSGGDAEDAVDLYESLEDAGYEINPTLKKFYENKVSGSGRSQNSSDLDSGDTVYYSTGETPQSSYTDTVKNSYSEYNDAALVVITRIGGEGFDLPRSMKGVEGARQDDDHYLQLDQNETDLLEAVCKAGFKKVVVIINSGSAMELSFLEDEDYYAYQENIDAAIWMGFPGDTGLMALGEILNGNVNPSGRTVDTYVSNLKNDPTWENLGDNRQENGDLYVGDGIKDKYYFVDYEEGIYVGYRYYETRGYGDEDWYDDAVVYPYGYGLSYTTFSWTVKDASSISGKTVTSASDEYTITVTVTNTGSVAGMDVVELYGHAPYTAGEIEKSQEVLLDFAKTELLEPGGSCDVTLTFNPYYLASYDYTDANGNGFSCYELDAGEDYALYISHNAHDIESTINFRVNSDIIISEDTTTGNTVENRYTDNQDEYLNSDYHLGSVMSRNDWTGTYPVTPTTEDRTIDSNFLAALKDTSTNNPYADELGDELYYWPGDTTTSSDLVLRDMIGVDYDDESWDELVSRCTFSELVNLCNYGAFKTNRIDTIEKPLTNDTDGPTGFVNFMDLSGTYDDTCYYCAEVVMGSTWNTDLIYELGEMIGNEGLIGAGNNGNYLPYSGWYAPGVNIHRSAFGGRNFEYFSEDGVFSGKMAAAEISGCRSKGVYCYVKHFALNEQETHRSSNGCSSWVTEQAMREIYLKPFEIAVKEGGATAVMSSFNRIGTRWTGGDYRLLTEILRDEWGFKGMVITDFNTTTYMNLRQMSYAGGDLDLATVPADAVDPNWCDESSASDVAVLMQCSKNILYTVANSNAMNRVIDHYDSPLWQTALIYADIGVALAIAIWGGFAITRFVRGKKS